MLNPPDQPTSNLPPTTYNPQGHSMFPFWLDVSSGMVEPVAVVLAAVMFWIVQFFGPRGC